jgi:uncharacterized protein YdeI (YjbR/CyaY-like superfamily)
MTATFFPTPADLRRWFEKHHATEKELLVGFFKTGSGKPSITWPQSVDEALCVGWIDGIRRSVDDERYTIRFTPRKAGSIWSAVNIRRAQALIAEGRMRPAGLTAFEARTENRSGIYAYEQRRAALEPPYERIARRNKAAWAFFERQPPSYKKVIGWYVVSAKKEETRLARLGKLIEGWAQGLTGRERWPARRKVARKKS